MDLSKYVRAIVDFPKKGILFRDITPLLQNPKAFRESINQLAGFIKKKPDYILCAESRGFIFGSALAYKLGCGLVIARKPGKLPYKTYRQVFSLEYGQDAFEIHRDAFKKKSTVVILDDLLATGGTAQAMIKLVKKFSCKVQSIIFVIELEALKGRNKLKGYKVHSLIKY